MKRLYVVAALTLCVLSPAGPSLSAAASDQSLVVAPFNSAASVPADTPMYRLGDAAKPFGWSTVVGDFNTDGKPDVAVADHIARRSGSYRYQLEFSVSGLVQHQRVSFESIHEAITVRLADVDSDNDLDIIVAAALSDATAGVWLNDGQGHFSASTSAQGSSKIRPGPSLGSPGFDGGGDAFNASPRRAGDGVPAAFQLGPLSASRRFSVLRSALPRSFLRSDQSTPRAPPPARLEFLS